MKLSAFSNVSRLLDIVVSRVSVLVFSPYFYCIVCLEGGRKNHFNTVFLTKSDPGLAHPGSYW